MARLFIVSNRVSLPDPSGRKRAGGLEVALRGTLKRRPALWLGWSGGVKPKKAIETRTIHQGKTTYVVTDLSKEDYQEYYSGFANSVLWPILHYRLDLAEFSRRDLTGYFRVNDYFAREIAKLLEPDDIVWVHDYHLIPFAKALRDRGYANKIGFFLHIPLPPPEILTALPNHERLIPTLCEYDLVGFQTDGDATNFARYLTRECGFPGNMAYGADASGRTMRIGTFPVGIETEQFAERARRAASSSFVRRVRKSVPGAVILGVDRLDYSKGITLRMEAFEKFLIACPDWHRHVTYMQITPGSRDDIPEYAEMKRDNETIAGRINASYGDVSWTPVRYVNTTYSRTALSGLYRMARVALVTPLRDGMNLVAKEYVAAQNPRDPGVLILSRFAGAAIELNAAVLVTPYAPAAVAVAIAAALSMPLEERRSRQKALFEALRKNDIADWGENFLTTLSATPAPTPLPAQAPREKSRMAAPAKAERAVDKRVGKK